MKPENFEGNYSAVYNPGCFSINGDTYLLPKLERHKLRKFCYKYKKFYSGEILLLVKLDSNNSSKVNHCLLPKIFAENIRCDDFRTFKFLKRIFVNHTTVKISPIYKILNYRNVLISKHSCLQPTIKQGISELKFEEQKLIFKGYPKLDFAPNKIEKNWIYLPHRENLFLLYSFSPFIILKMSNLDQLRFETIINEENEMKNLKK